MSDSAASIPAIILSIEPVTSLRRFAVIDLRASCISSAGVINRDNLQLLISRRRPKLPAISSPAVPSAFESV
jgi:hypothetical protein